MRSITEGARYTRPQENKSHPRQEARATQAPHHNQHNNHETAKRQKTTSDTHTIYTQAEQPAIASWLQKQGTVGMARQTEEAREIQLAGHTRGKNS